MKRLQACLAIFADRGAELEGNQQWHKGVEKLLKVRTGGVYVGLTGSLFWVLVVILHL